MLKILRHKKTAKRIWIGLAIIIVPAFALWGFGGAFRSREETKPLGRIFGRAVSDAEFRDAVSAVTIAATIRFGDKLPEIEKYLDLDSQAWQRLVLLAEAKRRKIKVSDKEIIDLIERLPYFQYKGRFDNRVYTQTLQYVFRVQPRVFEEQTRSSLMLTKLYQQVTDNVKVEDRDVRLEYEKANQEISIDYLAALFADFAKNINPTEGQLKDYFEKNKEGFKEERGIPAFEAVKSKVKEAFVNNEALRLAEQKINQCAQELKSRTFNETAKACGLKLRETPPFKLGDALEGIGQTDLLWEAAKSLKPEENSSVIPLRTGFYIVRVKSIAPIDEKKYGQEKSVFTQRAIEQKKEEQFAQFLEELNKKAR